MGTDVVRQRERWIVLEEFSPYVGPLEGVELVAHALSPTEMVSPSALSFTAAAAVKPNRSASPTPSAPTAGVTRQVSTKSTKSNASAVRPPSAQSQQSTHVSDQLYMLMMQFDKSPFSFFGRFRTGELTSGIVLIRGSAIWSWNTSWVKSRSNWHPAKRHKIIFWIGKCKLTLRCKS